MALFLIVLNPVAHAQAYDAFRGELAQLPWARVLATTWIVDHDGPAEALYLRLEPFMQAPDQLLVIACTPDYSGCIERTAHEWLALRARE